uniref:OmpA family protein n=1 Tax=Rheinheimera sp. TaxID=1869214 RepID=UPI00404886C1
MLIPRAKLVKGEQFDAFSVVGKQTGHIYRVEGQDSALQIAENYLDVVERLNGELLLLCRSDCGQGFSKKLIGGAHWPDDVFSELDNFSGYRSEHYYILAKLGPQQHPTYIQWLIQKDTGDTTAVGQIITEPQQLQLGLVNITADAITTAPGNSPASADLGPDKASGGDHPLISRYQGARLTERFESEYTEVLLPTGIADDDKNVPHLKLAGKSTLLHYEASKDQSTLQVFRNYQQALQQAGFTILFSCEHQSCGKEQRKQLWKGSPDKSRFKGYLSNSTNARQDYRMLTAHKTINDQEIYLSVYILKHNEYTNMDIAHDIVELSSMQTNRVSIDADYLQNELNRSGKVVLHGLHFASDSATLLPESAGSLDVITAYLTQHPAQTFYVVGHTDNSGSHSHNMQLSKARANSILQALVKQGIKADRLLGEGVGAMSPQQHNGSSEGKAANRRVELVLR